MTEKSRQRFADRTAIVTGSTRGIGADIAIRLAAEGASVVVAGRTKSEGEATASSIVRSGGEAMYVQTDLRSDEDIRSLIDSTYEEFGCIDILVNNAAVQTDTTVQDTTLDEWDLVLETNFRAYWLCAKYTIEYMSSGSIINVSSNHAEVTMPAHFPYNAVKAGIDGMTRAMALEFGPDIRVNTVNPGWVIVDRTRDATTEAEREELRSIHPVGRLGRSEDIAAAVAYLASDEASYVTGTNLLVDGGRGVVMQDNTLPDYDP